MDLKLFRHDHHLYQGDLADLFHCQQSNISQIESGDRKLSQLQIKLLIDKYGMDVISKYLDDDDTIPASAITINAPKISGNTAPVQNGDGNTMATDTTLINVMKQQSEQIAKQSDQISRLLDQQAKLIELLENKYTKD